MKYEKIKQRIKDIKSLEKNIKGEQYAKCESDFGKMKTKLPEERNIRELQVNACKIGVVNTLTVLSKINDFNITKEISDAQKNFNRKGFDEKEVMRWDDPEHDASFDLGFIKGLELVKRKTEKD